MNLYIVSQKEGHLEKHIPSLNTVAIRLARSLQSLGKLLKTMATKAFYPLPVRYRGVKMILSL